MLKVKIVCVGKIKEKFFKDAVDEYVKRLGAYCNTEITEINESRIDKPNAADVAKALTAEGKNIIAATEGLKILCDVAGKQTDSDDVAKLLKKAAETKGSITFVVGSSFGVSEEVKAAADERISFGKITLPHQLFRVVLCEQIYRGFTILNGTPYHK